MDPIYTQILSTFATIVSTGVILEAVRGWNKRAEKKVDELAKIREDFARRIDKLEQELTHERERNDEWQEKFYELAMKYADLERRYGAKENCK